MNQLSFIDKISILIKLLFSSPVIIGIFGFSLVLMILLFFYSKLNKKIMKFVFILLYLSIIGFAVFKYGSYFLTSIDSFVTLFMANIYFPIIPVYVFIMLISFVIMIITLSGKNNHKFVKIINTVFFTLIQMFFAIFIYVVESSKIDLSMNSNLYSNEQTMTLLELGMGLFVLWIIILLVIFYLKKADKIFKVKSNDETDDFDEYINDYNEPSNVVNGFNNNILQNLVPEVQPEEEVLNFDFEVPVVDSFDSDGMTLPDVPINNSFDNNNNSLPDVPINNSFNNSDNILSGGMNSNVFSNFDFLSSSNEVVRKSDDVEIIDFE